ncbi:hypothetical protein MMC13_007120 [Lambiella insularis]|nr:hypothetical protein [Lambiella insularis]
MSPSPQLAPVGSSTYNSPTMFVGDGTWDAQRNTFLLPNLQGLNFATMQYNGMGNRFKEVSQYYDLIHAHGIIAAITFLFVVPIAVLVVRFYKYRNPYMHVRIHIWLQIITVLLTTVIFILGFFAVGPERSLTNPHHGIGVAIYVLVLVQFIGGWWVHAREKRKRLVFEPVKLVLHKWFGRTIALLGLVQIPLGLTLYGSPLYLFVLYTLTVFTLLVIYFILDYRRKKRRGRDESNYSYASGSGSIVQERRRHGRIGNLVEGAAVGTGLGALANRFRARSRRRDDPEVIGSRRHSGSYLEEEKYSQYGQDPGREGGLRSKLLGIGALAGASYYITRLLGRSRHDEDREDSEGTVTTEESLDRVERVEEGRPLPSGQHPLNQPLTQGSHHRRSTSLASEESYVSGGSPSKQRRSHGLRNAVLGLGAVGAVGNIFKRRRERKEQRRIDALRQQDIEEERMNRQSSQRYTGDGLRPPRRLGGIQGSTIASTDFSEEIGRHRTYDAPPPPGGILPVVAGGATAGAILAERERDRQHTTLGANNPVLAGGPPSQPVLMPPVPPDHQGILHHDSSGSEMYTSVNGRAHRRHQSTDAAAAAVAGGAAGLLAGEAISNRRERNRSRTNRHSASAGEESVGSQGPVSVKVKMHSDGRHVTLRRLPEEEAAAERAARRTSRDHGGRRRNDSASTLGSPAGGERWRRTEALERHQAMEMERERANLQAAQAQINQGKLAVPQPGPFPAPPPIPMSSSPLGPAGSVGSPGTYDGTATEASADYANNRRRRRAERAQAKLAREGRGGPAVEYT